MRIRNKYNLIMIIGLMFIGSGTTLAFFSNSTILENLFSSANYRTVIQENFISPDNWTPGDTTSKTLVVVNEGDSEIYARVCIEDEWVAMDGTILPNHSEELDEDIAILNLDNQTDWLYAYDEVEERDCYIYKTSIGGNESSTSFMSGVTYNPNYSGGIVCTTDPTTQSYSCKSSTNSYDGAEYTLNLIIETIQKRGINESGWGFGYSNDGNIYNYSSPEDVLDVSSYNSFLRKAVTDNGLVLQAGIGIDDDYYYITGGDGGTSYEDNKDVLDDIFGSSNCSEVTNGSDKTYTCSDNGIDVVIKNDGYVNVVDVQEITIDENGNASVNRALYNVLKLASDKGIYAREYTGTHQDSIVSLGTEKIYHWYANSETDGNTVMDKNNVIFAGFCWKSIRTTDTGGVKLIYNGEPINGKCLSNRSNHKGILGTRNTFATIDVPYLYGDTFDYDITNNTFTIKDNLATIQWNDNTYKNILGKYTCLSQNNTCSTLYQVGGYINSSRASITSYTIDNIHYSEIGTSPYNAHERSPAFVGYMFNELYNYEITEDSGIYSNYNVLQSMSLSLSYWYADSISYDSNTGNYSLVNPYEISSSSDYPSLVGKYTFGSTSSSFTDSEVYYIAGVSQSSLYYGILSNGLLVNDYTLYIGNSVTLNQDDTYTINSPTTVTLDSWYQNYSNYPNKYICVGAATCSEPMYSLSSSHLAKSNLDVIKGNRVTLGKSRTGYTLVDTITIPRWELYNNYDNYSDYIFMCGMSITYPCDKDTLFVLLGVDDNYRYYYIDNYYFGSNVTWDGGKYTLTNPQGVEIVKNASSLATHHYFCLEHGATQCTKVGFAHDLYDNQLYYFELENGVTIERALEIMLKDDNVNKYNSTIKGNVEAWYEKNMLEYDNYLEDTVFCNDRLIKNLNSYSTTGAYGEPLQFNNLFGDLTCTNVTDKFSISNDKAKLKYKVGLITKQEIGLFENYTIRVSGDYYWTMSPYNYYVWSAAMSAVTSDGTMGSRVSGVNYGVRPVISLKAETEFISGNGKENNPFIISIE